MTAIAGATMRGNVGDKLKGIRGFIGATELDNVELAGDVNIDNLVGLPGIRASVAPEMAALAAPILVKAHVASSCQLKAVTGGDINIAVQPSPELGVRAVGESNLGRVNIAIDAAVAEETASDSSFQVRRMFSSPAFDTKRVRIEVRATSGPGNVNISSIPAAPLAPPRPAL